MSTLLMISLILAGTVNWITATVYQKPAETTDGIESASSQSTYWIVSCVFFLAAWLVCVPGIFWLNWTAPPEYVAQKMAKSDDPECLRQQLNKIVKHRALVREDVINAGRVCNAGTKNGVAVRSLQQEAINSSTPTD